MISLQCPNCAHDLRIDDKYRGRAGRCKHCNTKFMVTDEIIMAPESDSPFDPIETESAPDDLSPDELDPGLATPALDDLDISLKPMSVESEDAPSAFHRAHSDAKIERRPAPKRSSMPGWLLLLFGVTSVVILVLLARNLMTPERTLTGEWTNTENGAWLYFAETEFFLRFKDAPFYAEAWGSYRVDESATPRRVTLTYEFMWAGEGENTNGTRIWGYDAATDEGAKPGREAAFAIDGDELTLGVVEQSEQVSRFGTMIPGASAGTAAAIPAPRGFGDTLYLEHYRLLKN